MPVVRFEGIRSDMIQAPKRSLESCGMNLRALLLLVCPTGKSLSLVDPASSPFCKNILLRA
jgi:hypothetical protein